jgi:two-component system response regulator FixJ
MSVLAALDPEPGLVFVVDGDAAVRRSLRFALGIDGFRVETYSDAESFLRFAERAERACLVVDHHLADMTGVDLIERLRARDWTIPFILTVTNPSPALVRRVTAAGIALVEKPLLGNALLDQIRQAFAPASNISH